MRFKLTIFMLFAISELFAQSWITNDGIWLSPVNRNIGIQKSFQVGDLVGTDTLGVLVGFNYQQSTRMVLIVGDSLVGSVNIGTIGYETLVLSALSSSSGFSVGEDNFYNLLMNRTNTVISKTMGSHNGRVILGADRIMLELVETSGGAHLASIELDTATGITIQADDTTRMQFDANGDILFPTFAGSGNKLLKTDNTGLLGWADSLLAFIVDANDNMYAGLGALPLLTTGTTNLVIGKDAGLQIDTTNFNIAIGQEAMGNNCEACLAIGYGASPQGTNSIVIGAASSADTYSIALGVGTGASDSSFAVGTGYIRDVYFGGQANTTPLSVTVHAPSGNGTNKVGADFIHAAGQPTGDGLGGSHIFQTAEAGASGTALRALVTHLEITQEGYIIVPTMPTDSTGLPSGVLWNNSGIVEIMP